MSFKSSKQEFLIDKRNFTNRFNGITAFLKELASHPGCSNYLGGMPILTEVEGDYLFIYLRRYCVKNPPTKTSRDAVLRFTTCSPTISRLARTTSGKMIDFLHPNIPPILEQMLSVEDDRCYRFTLERNSIENIIDYDGYMFKIHFPKIQEIERKVLFPKDNPKNHYYEFKFNGEDNFSPNVIKKILEENVSELYFTSTKNSIDFYKSPLEESKNRIYIYPTNVPKRCRAIIDGDYIPSAHNKLIENLEKYKHETESIRYKVIFPNKDGILMSILVNETVY